MLDRTFGNSLAEIIEEAMRRHDDNPRRALSFILAESSLPMARQRYVVAKLAPPRDCKHRVTHVYPDGRRCEDCLEPLPL